MSRIKRIVFRKRIGNLVADTLDDLTHLEINTILKDGMVSSPSPETVEELANEILDKYKKKLYLIIQWEKSNKPEFDFNFDPDKKTSFQEFRKTLKNFAKFLDDNHYRLDKKDYIILLRMRSFCAYLGSQSEKLYVKAPTGSVAQATPAPTLYNSVIEDIIKENNTIKVNTRQQAKFKRFFDLGTETIVMQTRFGIDGDVTTRIEESFAQKTNGTIIDMHREHMDLSVNYWSTLVKIASDIVGKIFDRK